MLSIRISGDTRLGKRAPHAKQRGISASQRAGSRNHSHQKVIMTDLVSGLVHRSPRRLPVVLRLLTVR